MIICIGGPCSTGKTTLIKELETLVKGITPHVEYGRLYLNSTEKRLSDVLKDEKELLEYTKAISYEMIGAINSAEKSDLIIFDRSPIDYLVNLELNFNRFESLSEETKEWVSRIRRELTAVAVGKVDMTFFTTASKSDPIEEDGFRPTDYLSSRGDEIEYFEEYYHNYAFGRMKQLPDRLQDRMITVTNYIIRNKF